MGFTKQAIIEQRAIDLNFPTLKKHYVPMMGNFQFSKRELIINMEAITRWMEYFPEYVILHQSHPDYNGSDYFLTDSF